MEVIVCGGCHPAKSQAGQALKDQRVQNCAYPTEDKDGDEDAQVEELKDLRKMN